MSKNKKSSLAQKAGDQIAWPIRCTLCGEGEVNLLAKPGRVVTYKSVPGLVLPEDLAIPTCEACGEQWIDRPTAAAMDKALELQYQERLYQLVMADLEKLTEQVTQGRLEQILGLSQGYLSKIRSGKSRPSLVLVSCLHLLAQDPEQRLLEMEESLKAA